MSAVADEPAKTGLENRSEGAAANGDERATVGFDVRADTVQSGPPGPAAPTSRSDDPDAGEQRDVRLTPGRLLPETRYRIERWLGSGSMGTVFAARQVDIDRPVAIKILNANQSRDRRGAAGFLQEARASARIGAPNIVDVLDFGSLPDGRLFMVMELLQGRSLGQTLSEEGPLELPQGLGVLRQMSKALAAAHGAGLVHRDVKPDNVFLVERDGKTDFVKVLDFGVAHHIGQAREGQPVGTPAYMAPEYIVGRDFDARADIYAFGCTACEILTGKLPFEAESLENLLADHLHAAAVIPSRHGMTMPPPAGAFILRCLAKDANDRFEDMADLEAAICEVQIKLGLATAWDDLPLPNVDAPRRETIERGLRRLGTAGRRRWPWAAGLVAALGIGWAGWTTASSDQSMVPARDAVAELAAAAKDAAAKAYYVYPPRDDRLAPTAFSRVVELERLGSEAAAATASRLRDEFASTLVRLGDEFWERPGGRPFARDYYALARIFRPNHPRARDRSLLTMGEVADLRARASEGDFSEDELTAVEPLRALAKLDPENPGPVIAQLRERRKASGPRNSHVSALIEDIGGAAGLSPPVGDSESVVAPPAEPSAAEGTTPEGTAPEDTAPTKDAPVVASERRNRARSRELTEQGLTSLRKGDFDAAEQRLHQALAADSRNARALAGLGAVYFERGNFPRAVKFYEKAARRGGNSSKLQLQLGDAYFKVERYKDAIAAYEKASNYGSSEAPARIAKVKHRIGG